MPRPSSPSVDESYRGERVRVFRLDRERLLATLGERARALLATSPDVLSVRLFGSLAEGRATPGSDADIWVLVRDGAPPFLERIVTLGRGFAGVGVGCDVIAFTESEWDELRRERRRLVKVVEQTGIELAARA